MDARQIAPLAASAVFAIAMSAQPLKFDAASVKVNRSGLPGGLMDLRAGGQFSAINETLEQLIRAAYNVDVYRIFGGPDWIRKERFDVEARANANVTRDQTREMLRLLLEDRFMLRVHMESREMPIYSLVTTSRDGATGPRLRPASPSACVERGPQPGRVPAGELPSCGLLPHGPGRLNGRSVPITLLVTQLSSITGRVVRDRTNLNSLFDIDVEWGLTEPQVAALAQITPPGGTPPVFDPDKPTLFTALQEQLGLRLETASGPVDVVAVDRVQRPTEN